MSEIFKFINADREVQRYVLELALRLGLFLLGAVISPIFGRSLSQLLRRLLSFSQRYINIDTTETYDRLIQPFQNSFTITGTLFFISLCLNLLVNYEDLYTFLGFFIYLALAISIIWFASKATQQIIRRVVINVVQRWFGKVNEVVLIFETFIYVLIVLFAVVIFAQGLRLNLIALGASLGIGGVAFALGAQQALGRIIGTIELYLDRPYLPGEYIRVNFNPYAEDVYGRVESIGLRSTKIRIVAKNTLMIIPNSTMAAINIENISRGKKVMAMICLDFVKVLKESEKALVKKVIEEASQAFWGFDKATTQIQYSPDENKSSTRVRVIFFITGSSENSLGLRKRLLELANEAIARRLAAYNLIFTAPEPTVYIDSPMSI